MHLTEALEQTRPGLLKRIQVAAQHQQFNQRTRQSYLHWISRFVMFHESKTPETLVSEDRQAFLCYLRDRAQISRAKMNQASQALAFFFEQVLGKSLDDPQTALPT